MAKLFDSDPAAGIQSFWQSEHDGSKYTVGTIQDVSPILEAAKERRSHFDERAGWKGEWHHCSHIPLTVYYKMLNMVEGDEHAFQKALKIWLNDPDNKNFRTRPGRV